MEKLWAIALKDIRTRFTDRTLLLIMIVAPLAISSIIGLAFGGLGRTASPIQHIPVAVINNDQADPTGTSFGAILANLLITGQLPADTSTSLGSCPQSTSNSGSGTSDSSISLNELIDGTAFERSTADKLVADQGINLPGVTISNPGYLESAAKAAVDKGIYTAVVIIPTDFSMALSSLPDPTKSGTASTITIYGNAGQGLSAGIIRSVVEAIMAQMIRGPVAIGAMLSMNTTQAFTVLEGVSSQDLGRLFACAFVPGNNLIQLSNVPIQAAKTSMAGTLLVTFGSAQALFFAMFTGQMGILSMYEERRNGTLQRIVVSPTPRWTILGGKLVGVFISVLFQLVMLVIALTVVGSLIEGEFTFIWGTDIGKLVLVLLAVSVVVSGLGMFLAGVLKGIEQANIVSSVLNIALGVLGGAFGFQLPRSVAQYSLVYWARDAFDMLAAGRGDISLNVLILFAEGVVMFTIGLILFNRKFEV